MQTGRVKWKLVTWRVFKLILYSEACLNVLVAKWGKFLIAQAYKLIKYILIVDGAIKDS